jgi:hypothetical protein
MEDFETATDEETTVNSETDETPAGKRFNLRDFGRTFSKNFVLFLSFGPGILGFLWLVSRILRR